MLFDVSITPYEKPEESVQKAVESANGLAYLPKKAHVFIKPNIVFWTKATPFPKWGVITTSRVVEDMVILLKEQGIDRITIGEGMVVLNPKDTQTPQHAFKTLGYDRLKTRYGIDTLNVFEKGFTPKQVGEGVTLNFSNAALESDFIVNLPVMKAHNLTKVSLSIKNLKGIIDISSRKKCHSKDPIQNLDYYVARLSLPLPPMMALLDGIYTLERGPGFDGKAHRFNTLVCSSDPLSADLAGAAVLGFDSCRVKHLALAAELAGRPCDLSDIRIIGADLESVARPHDFDASYEKNQDCELPLPLARQGIKGIHYRKYDTTMCTYCSAVNGLIISAIRFAWKNKPFDDIEVLTGKKMAPTKNRKKHILIGKCMYQANKDHPHLGEMIAVKGCPPKLSRIFEALKKAGIDVDRSLFENFDMLPGYFMDRYKNRPEFEEAFFRIN